MSNLCVKSLSTLLAPMRASGVIIPPGTLLASLPVISPEAALTRLRGPSRRRRLLRWGLCDFIMVTALLMLGGPSAFAANCPLTTPDQDNASRTIAQVFATRDAIKANYNSYPSNQTPEAQQLFKDGILDVTKLPYGAKGDGVQDDTCALQQALKDARDARLVTFLPVGTYKVSDQLQCIQGYIVEDATNTDPENKGGTGENFFLRNDDHPCVLRGSTKSGRATIVLDGGLPAEKGFSTTTSPKAVILFTTRTVDTSTTPTSYPFQPSVSFNQMIISVDVKLGGNPGAMGIDHQGAQGSVVEDVTVDATGAFAGLRGLVGSGGSVSHITVTNGQYGLYVSGQSLNGTLISPDKKVTGSGPSPLVSVVTLTGQTKNAIFYEGRGTLTVVGAVITIPTSGLNAIRARSADSGIWNGHLNLVDSQITYSGSDYVIRSNRNVYLNNVYVDYTAATNGLLVQIDDGKLLPTLIGPRLNVTSTGWTHIREYAVGGDFNNDGVNVNPLWIDGILGTLLSNPDHTVNSAEQPTPDLQSRHSWDRTKAFPTWEDTNAINARTAYGAVGDGIKDDTNALQAAIDAASNANVTAFFPKGTYRISRPLILRTNTRLIGVGSMYTRLFPNRSAAAFSNADPNLAQPLMMTDPTATEAALANATTALGFLQSRNVMHGAYALHWQAGAESVVRDVRYKRYRWSDATAEARPLIFIDGQGGGRWYNTWQIEVGGQGLSYRHLLVNGTRQPLKFYMLNPEHAASDVQMQFNDVRNMDIYAIKGETAALAITAISPLLLVQNSQDFRIFGHGGNAKAQAEDPLAPGSNPKAALFRVENSTNFLLANFTQQRSECAKTLTDLNPCHWYVVRELSSSVRVDTPASEWFVLYKRTQPTSPGTLQFSAATYSVNEGGGAATITVTRAGGSSGPVSVNYATGNGLAIAGSDYTAASGTITFANGDTAAKTFTVPIIDDALIEVAETVNLTLSNPTGGATLGLPSVAVLTIVDNDVAPADTLQFSASDYSIKERDGIATITVSRSGAALLPVSINYVTSNGTALASSDYVAASGTLNFSSGVTTRTFTVSIINDKLREPDETVKLTLSNPSVGATVGALSTTTLTILDDDRRHNN